MIRRLVTRYPDSVASLEALRRIPGILDKIPETVVSQGLDYRALRAEKLGVPWDQDIDLSGIEDPPTPAAVESETIEQIPTPGEPESKASPETGP